MRNGLIVGTGIGVSSLFDSDAVVVGKCQAFWPDQSQVMWKR
jgi:hypothetical protein